jgi:uncharacterized protein with GYD domain
MPTYIHLVNYTDEGVSHMKESPERLDKAREVANQFGGELTEFYLTMGQYDAVAMSVAPDAEAAAKTVLTIAGAGAVQTETLRAFTEDEYRDLIDDLP